MQRKAYDVTRPDTVQETAKHLLESANRRVRLAYKNGHTPSREALLRLEYYRGLVDRRVVAFNLWETFSRTWEGREWERKIEAAGLLEQR